jgi:hypothetical protein
MNGLVVAYAAAIDVTRVRFLGDAQNRLGTHSRSNGELEYLFAIEGTWVRHLADVNGWLGYCVCILINCLVVAYATAIDVTRVRPLVDTPGGDCAYILNNGLVVAYATAINAKRVRLLVATPRGDCVCILINDPMV